MPYTAWGYPRAQSCVARGNMEVVANFPIEVVDARNEAVPRAFIGVVQYPGGQQRRDRVSLGRFDPTDFAGNYRDLFELARGGFNTDIYNSSMRFVDDNRIETSITAPSDRAVHMEAVVYAVVPDEDGRVWFDSVYLPAPQVQDGKPLELQVNRAHIGRWPRESGGVVHLWRTVSPAAASDQVLAAELRAPAPSDRGTLSFDLHESVEVDYDGVPDAVRTLEPNGKWDRWFNVVAGLEAEYFLGLTEDTSFISNVKAQNIDGYEAYDEFDVPITPKVIDANGFNSVFDYQPAPYEEAEIPDDEVALALGLIAFFSGGSLGFAAAALGYYITTMEIAHEFFVRDAEENPLEISYEDIAERNEALGQFDKRHYDTIPTSWRRVEKNGPWVYAHRVPIRQTPDDDSTTRAALRGVWQVGSGLEALEREFELRSVASPNEVGVPDR